jgi:hypothetical protein
MRGLFAGLIQFGGASCGSGEEKCLTAGDEGEVVVDGAFSSKKLSELAIKGV